METEACTPPACAQTNTITAHGHALDAAHGRLREHDGHIASLKVQTAHCLERLARVESANDDNHRLLVTLEANVEGLDALVRGVATTAEATHGMLQNHIAENIVITERHTRRLIKIAGLLGSLVVLLAVLAKGLLDAPVAQMLGILP